MMDNSNQAPEEDKPVPPVEPPVQEAPTEPKKVVNIFKPIPKREGLQ